MKTAIATILALGLLAGVAQARTPFDAIGDSAPRSQIFTDINASAPRSVFEDIQATAPRSAFEQIGDTAPRSTSVSEVIENPNP